jgi:hypothetical protein
MRLRRHYLVPVLLAVFPVVYGLFGLHLGEDIGFDTLNYHFFDPYWLLTNHLHDVVPGMEQTYLSPLLNFPTYLLQRKLSGETASFLIAAIEGITIFPLYYVAHAITRSRTTAVLVCILGLFSAIAWSEIGTSFGDNLVAIPLISSIALIARYATIAESDRAHRRWLLYGAGLLAGIGAGLKLAEVPIVIGFLVAVPLLDTSLRARTTATFRYLAGAILGAGAAYGYWAYELTSRFGNPFLPFFNNIFHSKFAPIAQNNDTRFLPHNVIELVFYPLVWAFHPFQVDEVGFRELSLPLCEALLIVAVISRLYRLARTKSWQPLFASPFERYVVLGSSLSVLIWAYEFSIYRYLSAIEMLGFVLLWILTKSVIEGISPISVRSRAFAIAMALVCLICVCTEHPANFGRAGFGGKYFTVSLPKGFRVANNTVLMLSGDPYAYIVPFLPPSTDVIRLEGNLVPTPYENALIAKRLASASSIFITWQSVLRAPVFLSQNDSAWNRYGLHLVRRSCSAFSTFRGNSRGWIRFCRVAPDKAPAGTT